MNPPGGRAPADGRADELVEISVFGRRYRLRAADPERLLAAARLVDERLRKLAEAGSARDTPRLMLLSALELADDLIGTDERQADTAARLTRLAEKVEQTLVGD